MTQARSLLMAELVSIRSLMGMKVCEAFSKGKGRHGLVRGVKQEDGGGGGIMGTAFQVLTGDETPCAEEAGRKVGR